MIAWLKRLLPPSAPPPRQIPRAILQAAAFGLVIGPLLGVFFGWSGPIRAALVSLTYSVVFYSICALPSGYVRRHFRAHPSTYAHLATALAGFAGMILASLVMFVIFPGMTLNIQFAQVFVVLVAFALAWGQVMSAQERLEDERALAASRAQTKVLQAQMNPHFFFNTLNTISALIPDDPSAAQRTLGLMADMSRYAFTSGGAEVVPLARELDFVRAYLEIEQVRFGNRLRTNLPSESSVEGLNLPAFTLQPLIENAVRHGISRRMQGGAILVQVRREGGRFSLTVENEAETVVVSDSAFFKVGHALDNIRERLRLIYRGQASIEVSCPRANVVAVTIQAPDEPMTT